MDINYDAFRSLLGTSMFCMFCTDALPTIDCGHLCHATCQNRKRTQMYFYAATHRAPDIPFTNHLLAGHDLALHFLRLFYHQPPAHVFQLDLPHTHISHSFYCIPQTLLAPQFNSLPHVNHLNCTAKNESLSPTQPALTHHIFN